MDAILILGRVTLVHIAAESHDLQVLVGMEALLRRDHPVPIVEGSLSACVAERLGERGCKLRKNAKSPNAAAEPAEFQNYRLRENYVAAGY